MNPILQYWYFHLPNFILAAVMYTALGRLVLSFFVPPDWKNYIWRAFVKITDPAVKAARFITPTGVPDVIILIFTILWLVLLRGAFYLALGNFGLLPGVGAT
jgi:YggT family protein